MKHLENFMYNTLYFLCAYFGKRKRDYCKFNDKNISYLKNKSFFFHSFSNVHFNTEKKNKEVHTYLYYVTETTAFTYLFATMLFLLLRFSFRCHSNFLLLVLCLESSKQ